MIRISALSLRSRLFGSGATTSGVLGGIGSVHNVCHSICMGIVSAAALFGITLNILPLMFLQTYQLYFWWAAFVFTMLSLYFYLTLRQKRDFDRNLLIVNYGMLTFGLPLSGFLADYSDFFRFIGISLTVTGLFLLTFGKKLKNIFLSPEQLATLPINKSTQSTISTIQLPRLNVSSVLFAIVIGGFLINQYYMYRMGIFNSMKMNLSTPSTATSAMRGVSNMKLTAFDIALAKERMDKNNDGICDTCGMPMQQCIDSGQMDCNMGNNPNAIGILGSQHIHADFKVYVNGQALDFAKQEYYMKSSFMHVDNSQDRDDASGVLHMHAKKVPLWLFFRSLGINLTKDSLTLSDGQVLKNGNGKTLKFYLDGKKVDELGDYSFQPLDKLLISYGPENDSEIQTQINSVTNFAKDHQK